MEVQALPARRKARGGGNRHPVRTCAAPGDTPINECGNRMMNHSLCSKGFCKRGLLLALALMGCLSTAALGANSITGSVRNQSRAEPPAGARVVLLRLGGRRQR